METIKNCPGCDYSTDTERGLNIHIGRVHGRTKECKYCSELFVYHPSENNKFCSEKCYKSYRDENSENQQTECVECGDSFFYHPTAESGKFCSWECFSKSEINFNWKNTEIKKKKTAESICENCGEEFDYNPDKTKGIFCSQKCVHKSDKKWPKPGRNKVEREELQCHICDEKLIRLPSEVPKSKKVFCSQECRGIWVSESDIFRTTDSVYVEETDRKVRSGWEAEIDRMLYDSELKYEYEPKIFDIGQQSYTPDFKVNDYIIEVKGRVVDRDIKRAEKFMDTHSGFEYVVVGSYLPSDIHIDWDNRDELIKVVQ